MIAKVIALIAQTPAASPSAPSDRLTTFITATRPATVSGPPASPKLTAPTKGSVMLVTSTPAATGIVAATIWPASLTAGGRSKRSSRAPTSAMTTAPARIPLKRSAVAPAEVEEQGGAHEHAAEHRQPAEQRRRPGAQPALLGLVDRADAPRQPRRSAA